MAVLKTVTGKLVTPDGVPLQGVTVTVGINTSASVIGSAEVINGLVIVKTAVDGSFSFSLFSNSDLTPSNTKYLVSQSYDIGLVRFKNVFTAIVPSGAGPFTLVGCMI